MPIAEDIASVVVLILRVIFEVLERFEEKENLFAVFPIGTTMQDGGKRKRSGLTLSFPILLLSFIDNSFFYFIGENL